MLWLYDKQLDRFARASVGAVAQERGFYTPEIETELERLVERPANAVFNKLRKGTPLENSDRGQGPRQLWVNWVIWRFRL